MGLVGKFGGLLATVLALALAGCAQMFPERYRFELTVEVDTPQGPRSGSGVYEVRASNMTSFLPEEAKRTWGVRGEAVAVDLPNGRTLFALLRTNAIHGDMAGLSMTTLDPAFRNDIVESAERIASGTGVRQQAEVAPEDYPMLVTFGDLADSTSVALVETAQVAEMVLSGAINKELVGWIAQAGGRAIGVSGKDGGLVTAPPTSSPALARATGSIGSRCELPTLR